MVKGLSERANYHLKVAFFRTCNVTVRHIIHEHENAATLDRRQGVNGLVQPPSLLLADELIDQVIVRVGRN